MSGEGVLAVLVSSVLALLLAALGMRRYFGERSRVREKREVGVWRETVSPEVAGEVVRVREDAKTSEAVRVEELRVKAEVAGQDVEDASAALNESLRKKRDP